MQVVLAPPLADNVSGVRAAMTCASPGGEPCSATEQDGTVYLLLILLSLSLSSHLSWLVINISNLFGPEALSNPDSCRSGDKITKILNVCPIQAPLKQVMKPRALTSAGGFKGIQQFGRRVCLQDTCRHMSICSVSWHSPDMYRHPLSNLATCTLRGPISPWKPGYS